MPRTLVAFIHEPFQFVKGELVDADHPMVTLAPHLFEPAPPVVLPPPVAGSKPKKPTES